MLLILGALFSVLPAHAQAPRVVHIQFEPTERAQIAVWIEREDGTFLRTIALTQSVALYGIGNRPGALQMNSGFRWPYGRREGVLPVWAQRRALAPGARQFRRVIFQNRTSEGHASRNVNDYSTDNYYCLSFNSDASRQDALDAVSCPSVFSSDKGRFMTETDVVAQYAEPFETAPGVGIMRAAFTQLAVSRATRRFPLYREWLFRTTRMSPTTPTMRVRLCPRSTPLPWPPPPGGAIHRVSFALPSEWSGDRYNVWVEVNTEGDYNEFYNEASLPNTHQAALHRGGGRCGGVGQLGEDVRISLPRAAIGRLSSAH